MNPAGSGATRCEIARGVTASKWSLASGNRRDRLPGAALPLSHRLDYETVEITRDLTRRGCSRVPPESRWAACGCQCVRSRFEQGRQEHPREWTRANQETQTPLQNVSQITINSCIGVAFGFVIRDRRIYLISKVVRYFRVPEKLAWSLLITTRPDSPNANGDVLGEAERARETVRVDVRTITRDSTSRGRSGEQAESTRPALRCQWRHGCPRTGANAERVTHEHTVLAEKWKFRVDTVECPIRLIAE